MAYAFYIDAMLGKLARFLRLLGYDALYRTNQPVMQMLITAAEENRIIVSRSKNVTTLAKTVGVPHILICNIDIVKQLLQIKTELKLHFNCFPVNARCSLCNSPLEKKQKDEIIHLIPSGTANHYTDYCFCPKCQQVYWFGSHWEDICKKIEKVNKL